MIVSSSARSVWALVKRRKISATRLAGMPTPLSLTHDLARALGGAPAVTSTKRVVFGRIAVLDRVGQQVDQRQLQPADIDDQRGHVGGDAQLHATRIRHFAQLTRGFGGHGR